MQLTAPQSDIFQDESRFRVVVAGRRFGKTFLSTAELLRQAAEPGKNIWYVAPTYKAAKEIAWSMLIQVIPPGYIRTKNETTLTITMINDSTISLKGAEKPDNLRGRSLDFVVMDEFADMRPEAWNEVIRPSLADKQGGCVFIGTPKGRGYFYDLYNKGVDGDPNWSSHQYTTIQGGNVPPEEIVQARADLDERTFQQEFEARFVNYSGVIYYNFDRESTVRRLDSNKVDQLPLHIGMDFNLDPMSATIAVRVDDSLHVIDEIVMYGSNTDEMVDEIKQRYPDRQVTIYPDPACRQRKTSAGGRTDLSILQNAGFVVKVRKSHTAVRDRINALNSRLKASNGERHLFVSPSCKQTIRSLERQTYKEGTSQPDKDSGFDHMNDALSYMVDYLYPIRREFDHEQPTRWS